jgi:hypothetical protein
MMQTREKPKTGDDGELVEAVEVFGEAEVKRMKPKPEKVERQYPKFMVTIVITGIILFALFLFVVAAIAIPFVMG